MTLLKPSRAKAWPRPTVVVVLPSPAGVGFIGRSSLLIHPQYGAQVRYASILTTLEVEAGRPLEMGCGDCQVCQAVCPAGAIHDSPASYDLNACHAALQAFSRLPFVGHQICGICVKACAGRPGARG